MNVCGRIETAATIEQVLWQNAVLFGEKAAVRSGVTTVTYAELRTKILAASVFYRKLEGYQRGRTVLLAATKQAEFLYAYFGAHMAGLVVAPVAEDINPTRLDYICHAVNPVALVGFGHARTSLPQISLETFADFSVGDRSLVAFPAPGDVADILFTTGTTGLPKGVPLTFANEFAAAQQINKFIRNTTEDVELLALPVSHSFGLGRLRCCLLNAQTIILLGSFANVRRLFRTIEECGVTGFTMVPASWKFLQKMVGDKLAKFSGQLKYIEMGSSFFSEADKRHLAELFPHTRVAMHYGLTEASRSAFMEFHEDDVALSSVGKASPGVDIGIFGDRGERLPAGVEGEICVRGAHVMPGYFLGDNENAFYGEYFRTGDCGVMTEDGYLYLRSRIKELINVGGKKVAPTEVEEQILKIPGVEDCACVGVPDPDGILGEVVEACIVKSDGASVTFDQVSRFLQGRLEFYKIPAQYKWIDAIPRTHNGKVQRLLLK